MGWMDGGMDGRGDPAPLPVPAQMLAQLWGTAQHTHHSSSELSHSAPVLGPGTFLSPAVPALCPAASQVEQGCLSPLKGILGIRTQTITSPKSTAVAGCDRSLDQGKTKSRIIHAQLRAPLNPRTEPGGEAEVQHQSLVQQEHIHTLHSCFSSPLQRQRIQNRRQGWVRKQQLQLSQREWKITSHLAVYPKEITNPEGRSPLQSSPACS